jgi:hypothetical protein
MLGELRLDGGQSLAQLSNIIEALYIHSHYIDTRFELIVRRTKLLPHLLLKGIDSLVHPIQALVDSIYALVDEIQPPIDSIQPGFDVRQTRAYIRELRRKPGLKRGVDGIHRNFLSLLDAFGCHDFPSIDAIRCSR